MPVATRKRFVSDAQAMGRTEKWVAAGIELLRTQGAILDSVPLRCLHIQSAMVVIEYSLKQRREDTFPFFWQLSIAWCTTRMRPCVVSIGY